MPILKGLVNIAQLKRRLPDGRPEIDIDDIADLNEMLSVDAENEKRAYRHAESEAKSKVK